MSCIVCTRPTNQWIWFAIECMLIVLLRSLRPTWRTQWYLQHAALSRAEVICKVLHQCSYWKVTWMKHNITMQEAEFFILLFFYQTCCGLASSFLPLIASNGSPLCAVGIPSYTMQTDDIIGVPYVVPGATKCGFFCTELNSRINCTGFNYLMSGLCELYSNLCINFTSKLGCTYYQVQLIWITLLNSSFSRPFYRCTTKCKQTLLCGLDI